MKTFHVKNFDRFQHYKDRAPPWIKLYNELLDDYDFGCLQDASKLHLILIWLLASRSENKLPYDPTWIAKRINATTKVDLVVLVDAGFIVINQELHNAEQDASTTLASCLPRERDREERETESILGGREATRPDREKFFNEFWEAYPKRKGANPKAPACKLFHAAVIAGADPLEIISAIRAGAGFDRDKIGTEFIPQAVKWLRDKRWNDFEQPPPRDVEPAKNVGWRPGLPTSEEILERMRKGREEAKVA